MENCIQIRPLVLQKNEFRAEQVEKNGMKLLMLKTDSLSSKEEKTTLCMILTKAGRKQIALSKYSKKIIQGKGMLALEKVFLVFIHCVTKVLLVEKNEHKEFN